MEHKGQENLIPFNERTEEEQREIARQGGIRSGEARRKKATMKATLEMLLDETNNKGKTYRDLATLGLIKGAIDGKAENYKTIIEVLGELSNQETATPQVNINIIDNSNLEKVLYEDNNKQ